MSTSRTIPLLASVQRDPFGGLILPRMELRPWQALTGLSSCSPLVKPAKCLGLTDAYARKRLPAVPDGKIGTSIGPMSCR